MKKTIFLDAILVLLAVLFVYAAVSKILNFTEFKAQIGKSPLIMGYAGTIAWFIPSIEIIIAFFLFVTRFQLVALFASFFLMLLFTGYIFFIMNFSPYVPCSCGGVLSNMGWGEHLIFNIGFTLLSLVGIWLRIKAEQKNSTGDMIEINQA